MLYYVCVGDADTLVTADTLFFLIPLSHGNLRSFLFSENKA